MTKVPLLRVLAFKAAGLAALLRPVLKKFGLVRWLRPIIRGPPGSEPPHINGSLFQRLRFYASLVVDPINCHDVTRVQFDGADLLVDVGEVVGRELVYSGHFEQFEVGIFSAALRPGDVVIDVGANVGLYSVLASRRISGAGVLHAFEPNARVYGLLQQNLAMRASGCNVVLHREAVGSRPGTVRFSCTADSAYSGVIRTNRSALIREEEVRLESIDNLVAVHSLAKVDLLKVDVEGYEPEVIEGARELLLRPDSPIVFIEISDANLAARGHVQRDVVSRLESLGLEVVGAVPGLPPVRGMKWSPKGSVELENFVAFKAARADRLRPLLSA